MQYMNNFVNTSLSLSSADFRAKMNQPTTIYNLDLLFYCGKIINAFLDKIYTTYFNCYQTYKNDLVFSKTLLVSLALTATMIGVLFLCKFYRNIYINQHYLKDIIRLVKTDCYIN